MVFISGGAGFLILADTIEKIKSVHQGTAVLIRFPQSAKITKYQFYKIVEAKNE